MMDKLKILTVLVVLLILSLLKSYYVDMNGLWRCEGSISIVKDTSFCIKR